MDLLLIHWPGVAKLDTRSARNAAKRLETWRVLEDFYRCSNAHGGYSMQIVLFSALRNPLLPCSSRRRRALHVTCGQHLLPVACLKGGPEVHKMPIRQSMHLQDSCSVDGELWRVSQLVETGSEVWGWMVNGVIGCLCL